MAEGLFQREHIDTSNLKDLGRTSQLLLSALIVGVMFN